MKPPAPNLVDIDALVRGIMEQVRSAPEDAAEWAEKRLITLWTRAWVAGKQAGYTHGWNRGYAAHERRTKG